MFEISRDRLSYIALAAGARRREAARHLLSPARMRRTERFAVELPVVWNRAGHEIRCTAVDVNEHGLYLCTDEIVEHGVLIRLKVQLPSRELEMFVTARFVGVTASGRGIGCEIFLIDDMSRCFWVSFYQELAASFARTRKTLAFGG